LHPYVAQARNAMDEEKKMTDEALNA